MSLIVNSSDKSRGGFQDRDVGRSNFGGDFGPSYGTDFARFSDPPDPVAELKLFSMIQDLLAQISIFEECGILVRNGFVFLKGSVPNEKLRDEISHLVSTVPGVIEVQNHIHVSPS